MTNGGGYGESRCVRMGPARSAVRFKEAVMYVCHESDAPAADVCHFAGAERLGRRLGWEP